jgi:hypothetical protein
LEAGSLGGLREGWCEVGGLARELVVVQFPDARQERDPGDVIVMPWNPRAHGRKFLRPPGRYRDYLDARGVLFPGTATL